MSVFVVGMLSELQRNPRTRVGMKIFLILNFHPCFFLGAQDSSEGGGGDSVCGWVPADPPLIRNQRLQIRGPGGAACRSEHTGGSQLGNHPVGYRAGHLQEPGGGAGRGWRLWRKGSGVDTGAHPKAATSESARGGDCAGSDIPPPFLYFFNILVYFFLFCLFIFPPASFSVHFNPQHSTCPSGPPSHAPGPSQLWRR